MPFMRITEYMTCAYQLASKARLMDTYRAVLCLAQYHNIDDVGHH